MHYLENRVIEGLSLSNFKTGLKERKISLVFSGMFSQEILSLLGVSLRRLENSEVVARRLFGMVIEMTQNIRHYSAQRQFSEQDSREIGVGIIGIGQTERHHIVSSGNYANDADIENIIRNCSYVNSIAHDPKLLKEAYRARRMEEQRDDKPGANLGFIDMARKSGNSLEYSIDRHEGEQEAFFILTVKINKDL